MGLINMIRGIARFGVVAQTDDGTKRQGLQLSLLDSEAVNSAPRFQNYGFNSVPRPIDTNGQGAEAVVVAPGGASSKRAAVVVDDRRYRPIGLNPGDVAVYSYRDDPTAGADSALHRISLNSSGDYSTVSRCGATTIKQVASGEITISSTGGNINLNPNTDERVIVTEIFRFPVRTTKELEAIVGNPGEHVYCEDGNGGEPCFAVWDLRDSKWHVIAWGAVIDDLIP